MKVKSEICVTAQLMTHLRYFEELGHLVHPDQELLVQVQAFPALLLIHLEIFLCKTDGRQFTAQQTDCIYRSQSIPQTS